MQWLSLKSQSFLPGSEIPKWCGLDQFLKGLFLICENVATGFSSMHFLFQCGQNSVH